MRKKQDTRTSSINVDSSRVHDRFSELQSRYDLSDDDLGRLALLFIYESDDEGLFHSMLDFMGDDGIREVLNRR